MAEDQGGFKQQLVAFWSNLPRAKRVALVVVTATVLLGVVAISVVGSQVHYAPLYAGLSTEDSAAIAEHLKELQVPHRINGLGVQVPEERVHELRLELANSGLPRGGGVGFEIFDSSRLGATEFEQKINLRRALEGEIARSITTIDGVQAARVHLVLPERRLFSGKSEGASASVVVRLSRGYEFGRKEVAGVVHLVSAAVPSLGKDRISLVSTDGVTLHRPDADGDGLGGGSDETQLQRAKELALSMENHVRTLLERITGPGGVDVRIHVDLEDAHRERTEEHYEPTQTALRSEQETEETTSREGATVAGVPGAQTNLPGAAETVPARSNRLDGNLFRRSRTRNWEVDRITEKITKPSGDIARLSAAVLIDGTYIEKDGVSVYQPRDPTEISRLEEVVKSAVGFNAERGDSIRVESAKFTHEDIAEEPTSLIKYYHRYLPYALGALGLVTLLLVFSMLMRTLRHTEAARIKAEAEKQQRELAARAESAGKPAALDPTRLDEQRARALSVAAQDPATAAIVLSNWLNAGKPVAIPKEGKRG